MSILRRLSGIVVSTEESATFPYVCLDLVSKRRLVFRANNPGITVVFL